MKNFNNFLEQRKIIETLETIYTLCVNTHGLTGEKFTRKKRSNWVKSGKEDRKKEEKKLTKKVLMCWYIVS